MEKERKNMAIHVAYEDYEANDPSLPEKNLLRAILLLAMTDIKKPGEVGRRATEYFLSPEQDYIFSFQSVCNYLSIDPATILIVTGLRKGDRSAHQINASLPPELSELELGECLEDDEDLV